MYKNKKKPPVELFVDARVQIIGKTGHTTVLIGCTGTIENMHYYPDSIGIRVDGKTNSLSKDDVFWVKEEHIETIKNTESENKNMTKQQIMMNENFIVAGVKFLSGTNQDKEYYYALYDFNARVGDLVVVQTGHHDIAVARISSIGEYEKDCITELREIISIVDTTDFKARNDRRDRIIELKKEMDKKVKELQEIAIYEMLAKDDDALKDMLTDYKSLLVSEVSK